MAAEYREGEVAEAAGGAEAEVEVEVEAEAEEGGEGGGEAGAQEAEGEEVLRFLERGLLQPGANARPGNVRRTP